MGRCPTLKIIFIHLQVILLHFTQVFSYSISHESVTSDVESSLIPYLGLPVPQPLLSLALMKTCEAGLVLSVTHILEPHCQNSVCMYVCVTTPSKPLNRSA